MKQRTNNAYELVRPFFKSSFSGPTGGNCVEVGVWKKSTASTNGDCVEAAGFRQSDGNVMIGVRDTKQHGKGPMLKYTRSEWEAFIAGVKAGEFDLE